MKIKICSNALEKYVEDNTDYFGSYVGNDYWERIMSKIQGKVLDVNTEFLFKYEYEIDPIKGVCEDHIRITDEYVEEVIDDARYGKARCDFCNSISDDTDVCTVCNRRGYLESLL